MELEPKYVIITPVRDEADYIENTVLSVLRQTILPLQWVIVDDGSRDGTAELIEKLKKNYKWIKLIYKEDRGYRSAGSGVIEAFYDGYQCLNIRRWDFIVKLDGDLSFNSDYFERCFEYFKSEQKLGIAGGTIYVIKNGKKVIDSPSDPLFHVRGATKIYRKSCWTKISPLLKAPGWDTIDEVKANRLGWHTRTFCDLELIQHKNTGQADGHWKNWFKNGLANYMTGYHPLFMLAKCLRRFFHKPLLLTSTGLWLGFCSGYLKNIPRVVDSDTIRYLRSQQLRRLMKIKSIYG